MKLMGVWKGEWVWWPRCGEGGENWNWVEEEDELELDEDEMDENADRGRLGLTRDDLRDGGGEGAVCCGRARDEGRRSVGRRPWEVVGRLGSEVDPRRSVLGVGFGRAGMSTGSVWPDGIGYSNLSLSAVGVDAILTKDPSAFKGAYTGEGFTSSPFARPPPSPLASVDQV